LLLVKDWRNQWQKRGTAAGCPALAMFILPWQDAPHQGVVDVMRLLVVLATR
jgi:hypothetical protein